MSRMVGHERVPGKMGGRALDALAVASTLQADAPNAERGNAHRKRLKMIGYTRSLALLSSARRQARARSDSGSSANDVMIDLKDLNIMIDLKDLKAKSASSTLARSVLNGIGTEDIEQRMARFLEYLEAQADDDDAKQVGAQAHAHPDRIGTQSRSIGSTSAALGEAIDAASNPVMRRFSFLLLFALFALVVSVQVGSAVALAAAGGPPPPALLNTRAGWRGGRAWRPWRSPLSVRRRVQL